MMTLRVFAIASLTALAACQGGSSSNPTVGAVRDEQATAPTDLQLICASRASEQFEVAQDQTLPVGSQALDNNQYRVDLTLSESSATCIIDDNANIISLTQA